MHSVNGFVHVSIDRGSSSSSNEVEKHYNWPCIKTSVVDSCLLRCCEVCQIVVEDGELHFANCIWNIFVEAFVP